MKIKFEVRLTASKALLAVLAAMVGMSAGAANRDLATEDLPKIPAPEVRESQKTEEAPVEKPKQTRTRNTAPKADPAPNKIIAPAPTQEAEEASQETEEAEDVPTVTIEEVRGFGGSLIQKDDKKYRPLVMAALEAHGASKFSELDPSEYYGLLQDLKAL